MGAQKMFPKNDREGNFLQYKFLNLAMSCLKNKTIQHQKKLIKENKKSFAVNKVLLLKKKRPTQNAVNNAVFWGGSLKKKTTLNTTLK